MMSILRIQDLNLSINGTSILEAVSIEISPGEVCGIIGESGSGKSLTAFSVMQLLPDGATSRGTIELDGLNVLDADEASLCAMRGKSVGMVFQEPMTALNPLQTIGQQVAETIRIHERITKSEALKRAAETLERCELPQDKFPLTRYPHELSGGQRQRVVIAMAIALRPKLLIADEPTTALDVTTQAEILVLLKQLVKKDGMGLMLITHDLAVVAQMADTIKVLRHGHEVEEAPTSQMLSAPEQPYTKSLWSVRALEKSQQAAQASVLSLQGIDASYGVQKVLHNVNIEVPKGSTVAVVGESGSGKSTTARVITGLLPQTSGSVKFNGEDLPAVLADRSKDQKRRIQMIYQMADTAMNPRQTVREIIGRPLEFYLGMRGAEKTKRIVELLEMIELDAVFMERLPGELSGGQKQRVAIARALAADPKLLLADEPTGALDTTTSYEIMEFLQQLNDEGKTILIVTHEEDIAAMCKRVVRLRDGVIEEDKKVNQVRAGQHV